MHPPSLIDFFLARLPSFSPLIPIAAAWINYKYLTAPVKVIFAFLLFSFLLILVNLYCAYHATSNLAVFHFYAIFEFGFILGFFSYFVDGILKKAIIPLVSIFAIWSIVNFFFIQSGSQLNTYTRPVEAIIITIYCISFFSKQTESAETYTWGSVSANWVTTGLLIFYACNFFIFIFSNYFLTKGNPLNDYFWHSYLAILIAENLLFTIAFYKSKSYFLKKT